MGVRAASKFWCFLVFFEVGGTCNLCSLQIPSVLKDIKINPFLESIFSASLCGCWQFWSLKRCVVKFCCVVQISRSWKDYCSGHVSDPQGPQKEVLKCFSTPMFRWIHIFRWCTHLDRSSELTVVPLSNRKVRLEIWHNISGQSDSSFVKLSDSSGPNDIRVALLNTTAP